MIYVYPTPGWLRGRLLHLPRLYAFPTTPEPVGDAPLVILDSGAFGLSKSGRRMDSEYFSALAAHYRLYPGMVHVAPDVYLNPHQTMRNWSLWQEQYPDVEVAPVIQFRSRSRLSAGVVVKQARFYAAWSPKWVAVSNPDTNIMSIDEWRVICTIIRRILGDIWLHCLGAGWDTHQVEAWHQSGLFDSMDSIAYYTDAEAGLRWYSDGNKGLSNDHRHIIAIENTAAIEGVLL